MKTCPNCQTPLDDNAMFCSKCGTAFAQPNPGNAYQVPIAGYDPYDHTAEFTPKDISENKIFALAVYLMGWLGIVIALIASNSSPYTGFHVRQALKLQIVLILMSICTALLCWTIIVPIAYAVMLCVLFVIKLICFFQVCAGKAKEPAIVRSLGFLK